MFGKVESLDRINTLHGRQIGTHLKDLKDFLDFQCLTVVFLRNFGVSVRFDVLTVHQVPLRLRKTFYFGRNILFKMRTQCLQVTCNLCFAL